MTGAGLTRCLHEAGVDLVPISQNLGHATTRHNSFYWTLANSGIEASAGLFHRRISGYGQWPAVAMQQATGKPRLQPKMWHLPKSSYYIGELGIDKRHSPRTYSSIWRS